MPRLARRPALRRTISSPRPAATARSTPTGSRRPSRRCWPARKPIGRAVRCLPAGLPRTRLRGLAGSTGHLLLPRRGSSTNGKKSLVPRAEWPRIDASDGTNAGGRALADSFGSLRASVLFEEGKPARGRRPFWDPESHPEVLPLLYHEQTGIVGGLRVAPLTPDEHGSYGIRMYPDQDPDVLEETRRYFEKLAERFSNDLPKA